MGQTASQCKPCSSADPVADTVKVNPTLLSDPNDGIKQEKVAQEEEADPEEIRRKEAQEAEEKIRQEAEDRRLQEERMEKERLQAEQERRQAQEEEARKQAEMARMKALEEEETERQRVEAIRVEEEEARQKLAQEQADIAAAQKAVNDFLKAHGFKQLSLPKKAFCGAPIHAVHMAVENNNPDLVRAMVRCGADLHQKGSSKKTPLEFAEQCNKSGSHDEVVKALRGER